MRLIPIAAAALFAAAAAIAQSPATVPSPPAVVDVAPAVAAEFAPLHWSPGSVASREDARVAAEIGGRVVEVAEVGARVRRGEPLARLDDAALVLAERQAVAELGRLQAQVDYARRQEARFAALVRDAAISGAQLDQASAERRMREQDLAAAQVALEQARLARRQSTVRAPFDGVVVERLVQRGEFLAVGAPVARLVNTGALEVRGRAPVELAGRLAAGAAVSLRDGGRVLPATLLAVVPVGDEASRQVELRASVPAGGGWVAGAAVELGVPRDVARRVVAVPRDALVLRRDGAHVVRVGGDGGSERVPVRTGAAEGELVEVDGAIRPGDRLVVRGAERLQPGQRVAVAAAPGRVVASLAGAGAQ